MAAAGVIILDTNGRPIISSHFRGHPSNYPLLHIDAFNAALARSFSTEHDDGASSSRGTHWKNELEPILWVSVPTLEYGGEMAIRDGTPGDGGWKVTALCHVEKEGLRFLVPIGEEANPLFGFSFLDSFLETLTAYLGEVTETTVRDNFDTIYMLIDEMLDEGRPMTMETNMLKDIVLPPTLVRKLLSAAGVTGSLAPTSTPYTAPIPWRRPNARYAQNEIYIDITESYDAIVDRKGKILKQKVWGRIECDARLNGGPELILSVDRPALIEIGGCALHPCVRHKKWAKDRILSFIPPDGRFKLMDYQVAKPESYTTNGAGAPAMQRPIPLPISLSPVMKLEDGGGSFSLTLISRLDARPLENVIVSIFLGQDTTSVSATATGDSRNVARGGASNIKNGVNGTGTAGCVGGGIWDFDPTGKVLRWTISSLTSTEKPATLTGSFVTSDSTSLPSPTFSVEFAVQHTSFSGLKVDQLRVTNADYKPFKGIRSMAKSGKYEVRW